MATRLTNNHFPVVDLFNNLNLYYSVVTEFCTVESNPTMSAGPGSVPRLRTRRGDSP